MSAATAAKVVKAAEPLPHDWLGYILVIQCLPFQSPFMRCTILSYDGTR
jgi:hypothetical protein